MKGTRYANGMIVTTDDLAFTEDSKSHAIEQLGADLLEDISAGQPKGSGSTVTVKGVIKDSGETGGFKNEPLKVYLTGLQVNIYSGKAYTVYEKKSKRIWVPDEPSSIPETVAAAVTNHSNIDELTEIDNNEFIAGSRPTRTNIKEFNSSDASVPWYVCIRYVEGTYNPQTIPNDGSQVNSKTYDSYEISVSKDNAATLSGSTGDNWIPLATLGWTGTKLTPDSDDRVYASCISSTTDALIVQHQDLMHENCIISEITTKLECLINNSPTQITFASPAFTGDEGILVNGEFVQTVSTMVVLFDTTMVADIYYIYIDGEGGPRATTSTGIADSGCILCSVYYDNTGAGHLQRSILSTEEKVRDQRRFGSIGKYQLSSQIVGTNYDYTNDLTIENLSDELINHRNYGHGNGLYISGTTPYASGTGSLGATKNSNIITIQNLSVGDRLFVEGRELNSRLETSDDINFATYVNATYYISALVSQVTTDINHQYRFDISTTPPFTNHAMYPICVVTKTGGNLADPIDLRVYGTVGYSNIQSNSNINGLNNLPQLMTCMYGTTPIIAAGTSSSTIHLTDDWGTVNYSGGGTISGKQVFATKPLITVYLLDLANNYSTEGFGSYTVMGSGDRGYYIDEITTNSFTIFNKSLVNSSYYWIAMGPSYSNTITAVLKGKNNPTYRTV